jgi:PASTA domain
MRLIPTPIHQQSAGQNSPGRRRPRRAATVLVGALVAALPLAMTSTGASAATVSTLTGQVSITSGLTGSPITNTSTSAPIATMSLVFSPGRPQDSVGANLSNFTNVVPITIVGTTIFNKWYTDTCLDFQTVSAPFGAGLFDRATGDITGHSLEVTVKHSVTVAPTSSKFGVISCPTVSIPDDKVTVTLSTTSAGGAALDQNGHIRLTGSGIVSAGNQSGAFVVVAIEGVLSPLPDRTPLPPCVPVPDVADDSKSQADQEIRAAGLVPVFTQDPGNDSYVSLQLPHAGDCVEAGTTVQLTLHAGPRP